jgi:hypothetical protein
MLTIRGRNAVLNVFELWVGTAGVISGLIFFVKPLSIDNNALTNTIGYKLSAAWSVAYFLAGLAIWYGLLRPSPRVEVMALFLLGAAVAINGIAIINFFGVRGAASAVTLLSLAMASWLRADFVMRTALRLAQEGNGDSG